MERPYIGTKRNKNNLEINQKLRRFILDVAELTGEKLATTPLPSQKGPSFFFQHSQTHLHKHFQVQPGTYSCSQSLRRAEMLQTCLIFGSKNTSIHQKRAEDQREEFCACEIHLKSNRKKPKKFETLMTSRKRVEITAKHRKRKSNHIWTNENDE